MSGTSGVWTFDYTAWATVYPEFATTVTQPQAQLCFNTACTYCDNTPCSLIPICDGGGNLRRPLILGDITAHIAQLRYGSVQQTGPAPAGPLVGRLASGAQGSVNFNVEFPQTPNGAWWNQTKYGAFAWAAMAPYRAGRYLAPPQIPLAAQSFPGVIGGWGWP